jgi:hypothetical protein
MNSLNNKEWELYNFKNIADSSEYDNILINKDIDNYFNNIINKPINQSNISIIKTKNNLNKFYIDYIEHNLIFIVVLIGIIVFLIIRHYIKDFDKIDINEENNKQEDLNKKQKNIIINKSKKLQIDKIKLLNYKKKLDKEKQQILSIIDELSNINESEYNVKNNQKYLNKDINKNIQMNYYNQNSQNNMNNMNNNMNNINNNMNNNMNNMNNNMNNMNNNNYDEDNMNYYDITRKSNKTNEIEGLYIEPPFL